MNSENVVYTVYIQGCCQEKNQLGSLTKNCLNGPTKLGSFEKKLGSLLEDPKTYDVFAGHKNVLKKTGYTLKLNFNLC